jgi:hypothetical protein
VNRALVVRAQLPDALFGHRLTTQDFDALIYLPEAGVAAKKGAAIAAGAPSAISAVTTAPITAASPRLLLRVRLAEPTVDRYGDINRFGAETILLTAMPDLFDLEARAPEPAGICSVGLLRRVEQRPREDEVGHALVVAHLVKKFIMPAKDELCEAWGEAITS